jgi:hypothetical protein
MLTDKVEMDHGFKDLSDEDLIKRAKALHAELGIGD